MNKKEIIEFKENLMNEVWVEDRHHKLEELSPEDARSVVESMDETEVYRNVNIRQFQEDYIADYLEYLWDISESAYWKHVMTSLDLEVGILWGDHMAHFEKMCSNKIPDYVLTAVLDFAVAVEVKENYKQDFEAIGCVVKAQVKEFGRLEEIKKYISSLESDKRVLADTRLNEMIKSKCNYTFY